MKRGLHWVAWQHQGMSQYGIGIISGKAPFAQILIVVNLENAKQGDETKPFLLNPEVLIDFKKLAVDFEIAPDRIKRMFNQPTRSPKEKEAKDALR